jgi:hypothetical protein
MFRFRKGERQNQKVVNRLSENITMLKYVRANAISKYYIYKNILKFNSEV